MPTRLTLPTPDEFDLTAAVCSYGYYVLAPNQWDAVAQTLTRPLRTADHRVVRVTCRAASGPARGRSLRIRVTPQVPRGDHDAIKRQVARMFHLDVDAAVFRRFHRLHRGARRRRFGRLFRSPTLFEDMVKTITGCNVSWPNTIAMNRRLCERVGRDGDFPTPAELAAWQPARLNRATRVGYRAERIIRLARDVDAGRLDLDALAAPGRHSDELYHALRRIHGFGDYAASNVLQLLDHYDRVAIDSETIRHFRQFHGVGGSAREVAERARRHYDRFAPFQFLAYWYELWTGYESVIGPADSWTAEKSKQLTAGRLARRT